VLASGLTSPLYTAIGLTSGVTYEFKVESRNSYDYSSYSDTLALLAAFKPEATLAPITYIVNDLVYIEWVEPVTNGWPITGYKVYIR
jgi:hypothetical protein